MPAFGPEQMTDNDVEMVVRFLRNDYLPPRQPQDPYSRGSRSRGGAPTPIQNSPRPRGVLRRCGLVQRAAGSRRSEPSRRRASQRVSPGLPPPDAASV